MSSRLAKAILGLAVAAAWPAATASAQANGQLWGNFTLQWKQSARRAIDVDIEPKALVVIPQNDPGWVELAVTPKYTHTLTGWLDVGGELLTSYTVQTD